MHKKIRWREKMEENVILNEQEFEELTSEMKIKEHKKISDGNITFTFIEAKSKDSAIWFMKMETTEGTFYMIINKESANNLMAYIHLKTL